MTKERLEEELEEMTNERLEKLIKHKRFVGNFDKHIAIKLDPKIYEASYGRECPDFLSKKREDGRFHWVCNTDDLYEISKKDFDKINWFNKTHAERTERFEPPMWEDIEKRYDFHFNSKEYGDKSSMPCGLFSVVKGERVDSREKPSYDNCISVRNISHYPNIVTFYSSATKENYEKACEIVRDLFTGEKK